MMIEWCRTHPNVHPPSRANPSDAGLDIHFSPPHSPYSIEIEPGASAILPTGIRFGIPHGYMLEVKNRSGMAAKRSLIVGACVIDSGYDGEVFINLHNVGTEMQRIKEHTKIAQVVMVPVVHFRAMERNSGDDLYGWYPITISDRADGALGSTGD
jgi:dUTP pyrophosphatase